MLESCQFHGNQHNWSRSLYSREVNTTTAAVHVFVTPEVVIADHTGRVLRPTALEDLEPA